MLHILLRRIELSLRSSAPKAMVGLEDLQEGQTVSGRVRRVEGYGVFVSLAESGVTGLCHISEVADEKVTDLPSMFQPGQGVRCSDVRFPEYLYQAWSVKRGSGLLPCRSHVAERLMRMLQPARASVCSARILCLYSSTAGILSKR